MSAKKQTSRKTTKSTASKAKKSASQPEPLYRQRGLSPRVKSILYIATAIFFVILLFVKGENIWTMLRGMFFGVFGVALFLMPVLFVYLMIMNEKEQHISRFKSKIILCALIILFSCALLYVISGSPHRAENFFGCLSGVFRDCADTKAYITFGCGMLGVLIGYPLTNMFGSTAATLSILVILAVLIFIVTNISLKDIGKTAMRVKDAGKRRAQEHRERREARLREREEYERELMENGEEPQQTEASHFRSKGRNRHTAIDIPFDENGKGSKKKAKAFNGTEIDIAEAYEPNAADGNPSDDLLDVIKRANVPYGKKHKPEKSITEDNAEQILTEALKRNNQSPAPKKQEEADELLVSPLDAQGMTPTQQTEKAEVSFSDIPVEIHTAPVMSQTTDESIYGKSDYNDDSYEEPEYDEDDTTVEDTDVNDDVAYELDRSISTEKKPEVEYHYPPVALLRIPQASNDQNAMEEMHNNAKKLVDTLQSFGVKASIVNICRGPSVTRYELQPAAGVKISKITNLSDDIALNLAANGVRMEAPIPGKAAIGIEVPNKVVSMVTMRELIDSNEFRSGKSKLTVVLGRDISGEVVVTDLAKMPHLLIAGTTGSGKSVCVNSILISILFKASPDEVKLLLIDPKMVEFSKYKGIPHLLIPVVSDAKKAAGALAWAVSEMLQRYKIFSEFDCKDIDSYNALIEKNLAYMEQNPAYINEEGEEIQPVIEVNGLPVAKEKMSRVVIAIDELADLMMAAPSEVEDSICRLAQMARAAGMHLILATQRPTVNVITGLIKANVPSRISLKVSSNTDSRTILDTGGGEKLIGKGDMLFAPVGAPKPIRVQGCYASDEEIEGVTGYIKKAFTAQYNADIEEKIKRIAAEEIAQGKKAGGSEQGAEDGLDIDAKMDEAIKCVIEAGQASTSLIQRRLKVGYARAGRMIDDMEQLGVVGPHQGSKPRDVLMTYNEWLERRHILGGGE